MYFCETPEQIIEAARELIRAGGEARASMRRIARIVGIAHSAIYRHFDNKAALLEELARREAMHLRTKVHTEFGRLTPPRQLARALQHCIEVARDDRHRFELIRDRAPPEHRQAIFTSPIRRLLSLKKYGPPPDPWNIRARCVHVWAALDGYANLFHAQEFPAFEPGGRNDDRRSLTKAVAGAVKAALPSGLWLDFRRPGSRYLAPFEARPTRRGEA